MPYGKDDYAQCPCCGKTAISKEEIKKLFGYRRINLFKTIPQSYCRACRSAHCKAGKPCKVKK